MSTINRIPTALRIPPDDLAEIDRRAQHYQMSRTEYMIQAATDQLPDSPGISRLDSLHERLARVERVLFDG